MSSVCDCFFCSVSVSYLHFLFLSFRPLLQSSTPSASVAKHTLQIVFSCWLQCSVWVLAQYLHCAEDKMTTGKDAQRTGPKAPRPRNTHRLHDAEANAGETRKKQKKLPECSLNVINCFMFSKWKKKLHYYILFVSKFCVQPRAALAPRSFFQTQHTATVGAQGESVL